MTTVLIVDDHPLVRQSMVKIVEGEEGFSVVGEAGDGPAGLELLSSRQPDILLLDVGLPGEDGLQIAGRVKRISPETRIILLTMHEDDSTIRAAVAIEVDGFVPKSASTDEVVEALRVVASGETYLSPAIAKRVMGLARDRTTGPSNVLTDRELEILRLMAKGHRAADVAGSLFVSVKTVKNHLTHMYAKLGVTTAAQAVAKAYQEGLALGPGA
jgi:DNA-binding NarL/FixJ family response regulator